MGKQGTGIKRTHSFFIEKLKTCKESHQKLKIVNEPIVNGSMGTGVC